MAVLLNNIAAMFSFLRSLITSGKAASFKSDLSGSKWERRCTRCMQRFVQLNGKWEAVGSVRNRRCGCRFASKETT